MYRCVQKETKTVQTAWQAVIKLCGFHGLKAENEGPKPLSEAKNIIFQYISALCAGFSLFFQKTFQCAIFGMGISHTFKKYGNVCLFRSWNGKAFSSARQSIQCKAMITGMHKILKQSCACKRIPCSSHQRMK